MPSSVGPEQTAVHRSGLILDSDLILKCLYGILIFVCMKKNVWFHFCWMCHEILEYQKNIWISAERIVVRD